MQKYKVTGMHCAACQARVEKAVSAVAGVETANVSLLTNSMGVSGRHVPEEVIAAVEKAGYGARLSASSDRMTDPSAEARQEERSYRRRLIWSVPILILLMYISMGHMMLDLPLPEAVEGSPPVLGLLQMILSGAVMAINKEFFISGFRSLFHLAPNMDSLVAIGSMTGYVWSILMLIRMISVHTAGEAAAHLHSMYFESSAMIVTLITIGKLLEARSKGQTTDALKDLMELAPRTALVERENGTIRIPAEDVEPGDVFLCRAGDVIPVDGVMLEGETTINESALTGESIPSDKEAGDDVSAGTINLTGYIRAKATRVGEDTTLAQIITMVSDAAATKAPIARIADRVSGIFVPVVIGIAIFVISIWILKGANTGYALARGISVLVVSCPCALGLATPVAIMVGSGVGARAGILFKTAASLEGVGRIRAIALDKTGTITEGVPQVTDLICADGVDEEDLIAFAASLEEGSEHPLGQAVVRYGQERGAKSIPITNIKARAGKGISGEMQDGDGGSIAVFGGSARYIEEHAPIPDALEIQADRLADEGKTTLFFSKGDAVKGLIALADRVKEQSAEAIEELKGMGISVTMLTGDKRQTAEAIGRDVGVDDIIAEVLPQEKGSVIERLGGSGPVAMVGDGINDAPALMKADIGIAIGAGTDVAMDAADIVLTKSSLKDVAAAIRLGRRTLRNIHENLFWAFFYNILLIPLAAGAYVGVMHGWALDPMLAAAAMSLSSFCVCMNALRLNLVDIYDPSKDKKISGQGRVPKAPEPDDEDKEAVMKKTMDIEGMMCAHCEATVKKALEELDGVSCALVSHEEGTAEVEMSSDVDDEVLKKAVEDKDYKVISIAE